jgi:hypothetical protein
LRAPSRTGRTPRTAHDADEIVISTHPAGTSNWLEDGVVERLRTFYEIPVVHVVVGDEGREQLAARPAA